MVESDSGIIFKRYEILFQGDTILKNMNLETARVIVGALNSAYNLGMVEERMKKEFEDRLHA